MQSTTKGRVRPLGALRHSLNATSTEKVPKLPPFSSVSDSKVNKLDKHYELHGSAMTVPPPKEEEKPVEKEADDKSKNSAKSDSSSSTKSQDLVDRKELLDAKAREKELKQQIASLQKLVEELRAQVKERDGTILDLQDQLAHQVKQEQYYKELYEAEKLKHEDTSKTLDSTQKELRDTKQLVNALRLENEENLKQLRTELEAKLEEVTTEKDKEISIRDEKLKRLKLQMAEALKGNSWERQQQLEELTKELSRIQEEADILRMKLKSNKSKHGGCPNCADSSSKLEKVQSVMKEKDQSIKELQSLVIKYEKQLSQQDELLRQWAESKGHKS